MTLQNNSMQARGDPEGNESLNLQAFDELIQKWIMEAKLS